MKKRILIVSHALEIGGVERSLIGLLHAINPDLVDVDLFLLRQEGELLETIPDYVNLLPQVPAYSVLARPMTKTLLEGHLILTGARLAGKIAAACYDKVKGFSESGVSLEYSHKFTVPFMPKIQENIKYDLAISFLTPHYIVAEKVDAMKKIAWIHTDYQNIQINVNSEKQMWDRYDYIASISESVKKSFLQVFPELSEKIICIENILSKELIHYQANKGNVIDEMPRTGIRLLSIGRYCHAKNFDNIPNICRRLLNQGLDVYWYLIGFGGDEIKIREKIAEEQIEDRVIILGKKVNPYPYIKECDIYVQPSRYEGKSVTVREAQILNKPVVITDYSTAESQLEDGVDGIIVPMDNEGCAEDIVILIKDQELLKQLKCNCESKDFSGKKSMERIMELMGDKM